MVWKDLIAKLKNDGLMVVCGVVVLLYLGFTLYIAAYVKAANADVMNIMVGQVSSLAALVVGYYFGSSKGSADKSKVIADSQKPNAGTGS